MCIFNKCCDGVIGSIARVSGGTGSSPKHSIIFNICVDGATVDAHGHVVRGSSPQVAGHSEKMVE